MANEFAHGDLAIIVQDNCWALSFSESSLRVGDIVEIIVVDPRDEELPYLIKGLEGGETAWAESTTIEPYNEEFERGELIV